MKGNFMLSYVCWTVAAIIFFIGLILYKKIPSSDVRYLNQSDKKNKNNRFVITRSDTVTHTSVTVWKMSIIFFVAVGTILFSTENAYGKENLSVQTDSYIYYTTSSPGYITVSGRVTGPSDNEVCVCISEDVPSEDADLGGNIAAPSEDGSFVIKDISVDFAESESKCLYVCALDNEGNMAYSRVEVLYDKENPEITLISGTYNSKWGRTYVAGNYFNLILRITDDVSGADRYVLKADGNVIEESELTGEYVYISEPASSDFACTRYTLEVSDRAGRTVECVLTGDSVYFDNSSPIIDVSSDIDGIFNDGTYYYPSFPQFNIRITEGSESSSESGISSGVFSMDYIDCVSVSVDDIINGAFSISADSSLWLSSNQYGRCLVQATDKAGNETREEMNIYVDTLAPVISISSDAIYICGENELTVPFIVTDIGSGVAQTYPADIADTILRSPFYGCISASATDNVGNSSEEMVFGPFLVENEADFIANTSLNISLPDEYSSDISGRLIYNEPVEMIISVSNVYSDIKSIRVEIYDKDELIYEKENDGQSDITVLLDRESFDLKVAVIVTGKTGHCITREILIGTDYTAPVVETVYEPYCNGTGRLVLDINERHLNDSSVEVRVNDVDVPVILVSEDEEHYEAVLEYEDEGKYCFEVSCTDCAGNSMILPTIEMVVDKTPPDIDITFSEDISSGYVDHFISAYLNVSDSYPNPQSTYYTINGGDKIYPFIGNNDSTTVINVTQEGEFLLYFESTDLAGNTSGLISSPAFITDVTSPKIEFEDNIAVSITDLYLNPDSAYVTLECYNHDNPENLIDVNEESGNISYWISELPYEKEYDDIYILQTGAADYAGNYSEAAKTYIVNRFGSDFFPAVTEGQNIDGLYLTNVGEVIVTEANLSGLVNNRGEVIVTHNGIPLTEELPESQISVSSYTGEDGKLIYEYHLNEELFMEDGVYDIRIISEDLAGNINDSDDADKGFTCRFAIDGEAPVLVASDIEDNMVVKDKGTDIHVFAEDNLMLNSVEIFVNDVEVPITGNNGFYTVHLDESNDYQQVCIIARDEAGNESVLEYKSILVSANPFVRWYRNTAMFVGSLMDFVGMILLMIYKHKF